MAKLAIWPGASMPCGRNLVSDLEGWYDGILPAVAHDEFVNMKYEDLEALSEPGAVAYDVKSLWHDLPIESRS